MPDAIPLSVVIADNVEHSIRRIDPQADGGNRTVPPTPRQKEQQDLIDRARDAQKTEPSAAAGCVREEVAPGQVRWTPPPLPLPASDTPSGGGG